MKLQDRFDYYLMIKLKSGKLPLESFGSKKDLEEPTLEPDRLSEQSKVFQDLETFKQFAADACMDSER